VPAAFWAKVPVVFLQVVDFPFDKYNGESFVTQKAAGTF